MLSLKSSTAPWWLDSVEKHVDEVLLGESGIELARRRSGGGAVLLGADDHVWVDLVVPADDPLAEDDVSRIDSQRPPDNATAHVLW